MKKLTLVYTENNFSLHYTKTTDQKYAVLKFKKLGDK